MPPKKLSTDFVTVSALDAKQLKALQTSLLKWFAANKRDLPWRQPTVISNQSSAAHKKLVADLKALQTQFVADKSAAKRDVAANADTLKSLYASIKSVSPYGVWVCEVMSQQTRIDVVIPFWLRWLLRFPDVATLAQASQGEVNVYWSGLGFYRRCQNLKKGAEYLVKNHNSALPSTYAELLKVPSIGAYTAAAVGSISFGVEEPAMDGNVLRVMARLNGVRNCDVKNKDMIKSLTAHAKKFISAVEKPGDFNEAMMELGATVCLPNGAPLCAQCPLSGSCGARALLRSGDIEEIAKMIPLPKQPTAKATVFGLSVVVTRLDPHLEGAKKKTVAIFQRVGGGARKLLAGFFSFPMVSVASLAPFQRAAATKNPETLKKLVVKAFTDAKNNGGGTGATSSFCIDESIPFVLNVLDAAAAAKISMPSALDKEETPHHVRHIFSHIDFSAAIVRVELPALATPSSKKKKNAIADPYRLTGKTAKWEVLKNLRSSTSSAISNLDEKILKEAGVEGADRRRDRDDE